MIAGREQSITAKRVVKAVTSLWTAFISTLPQQWAVVMGGDAVAGGI
jgi:hypothetical protein